MDYLYNNTHWNNVWLRGQHFPLSNTHVDGGGEKIIRLWENKWIDALTRSSHDLALWFLLRLDLLDGLQRELPRRVQLQQLLEQLRHVGALFRRRLDVLAFPHLLKSKMDCPIVHQPSLINIVVSMLRSLSNSDWIWLASHLESLSHFLGDLPLARLLVALVADEHDRDAAQVTLHL